MAYVSVTVEGGLFPSDLLDRIATGDAEGQRDRDFGVTGRLSDEIQGAFSDVRAFWDSFQRRLQHSGESATTITRQSWALPLLERLGYKDNGNTVVPWRPAPQIDGVTYAISHRAGDAEDAPPLHIVSVDQPLDRKAEGSRRNPHATVQEYLNRSSALWGIVTNGRTLRVLRNTQLISRPSYLEFDLQAMVEGNLYAEFVLLYRLLQRTRLPADGGNPNECLLETYFQQGIDEGGRVREHLREGVEAALEELGTALLTYPESGELREALRSGALDAGGYYRQLLRLVYRLLFLMVVEERKLLFPPEADHADRQPLYRHYSMGRLRDRAERRFAEDRHPDLWEGLKQTFLLFRDDSLARPLGLAALNGELFGADACRHIETAACENRHLLAAVYRLSTFMDGKVRRRVNYAGLDVEELGSVYESLLELHPRIDLDPDPRFTFIRGSERKQTGSYYTPPQLVRELIQSALAPVVAERLQAAPTQQDKEEALLDLRVCDPASGSGHFLLAAARHIARELAKVRSGDDEPAPETYRGALRDVIRSCIYAVDKNPLAVDLCKVALWLEGYNAGMPLSFLDNHIKWGDSLVGVMDLNVLAAGIPDEAYTPVTGDDRKAAAAYRKRNKREREGQLGLWSTPPTDLGELAAQFRELGLVEERTPYEVQRKEQAYQKLRSGEDWYDRRVTCDLWTAAFFTPLRSGQGSSDRVPTTDTVRTYLSQPAAADAQAVANAVALSQEHPFFHWPLEFPDVFARGGFDVVLGNPPWERIKLQEEEFFAARDADIAQAPNKAARERLIKLLPGRDPALAAEFDAARHRAEAQSKFVRGSGRFPLCGRGDVNTYSIFAELGRNTLNPSGRAGCIVPTGIAVDETTKHFFQDLTQRRALASLIGFENEEFIFPGVHNATKFCLLTLTGEHLREPKPDFMFFARQVAELADEDRHFTLTAEDLKLLNPNSLTCATFRRKRDADITTAIYRRVPVLIKEGPHEENPWDVRFLRMFDMANDSHLFRTREELASEGWQMEGNAFVLEGMRCVPLYEAKMIHHYDHRFASLLGRAAAGARPSRKYEGWYGANVVDPCEYAMHRYWVPQRSVDEVLDGRWAPCWFLGWRDICRSTDERTVIASVVPTSGVGDKFLLMMPSERPPLIAALLANLDSFVLDYCARQKVGGTSLKYFTMRQLPLLPPPAYERPAPFALDEYLLGWIVSRVVELVYTAWDMQPFAHDMGYDGPPFPWDEERRFLLRCELDAAFFHLYGIEREDVEYIMETFPIVKRKDEAKHGEYRTKRVILEIYDAMSDATCGGAGYQSYLPDDPAAADIGAAEPTSQRVHRPALPGA